MHPHRHAGWRADAVHTRRRARAALSSPLQARAAPSPPAWDPPHPAPVCNHPCLTTHAHNDPHLHTTTAQLTLTTTKQQCVRPRASPHDNGHEGGEVVVWDLDFGSGCANPASTHRMASRMSPYAVCTRGIPPGVGVEGANNEKEKKKTRVKFLNLQSPSIDLFWVPVSVVLLLGHRILDDVGILLWLSFSHYFVCATPCFTHNDFQTDTAIVGLSMFPSDHRSLTFSTCLLETHPPLSS